LFGVFVFVRLVLAEAERAIFKKLIMYGRRKKPITFWVGIFYSVPERCSHRKIGEMSNVNARRRRSN
jgi:hypothetical protein